MRERMRATRVSFVSWLCTHRAELLLSLALLSGWTFTTAAIAHLTAPVVWLFSAGLFGFALAGFQMIGTLAWKGLYALTRGSRRG